MVKASFSLMMAMMLVVPTFAEVVFDETASGLTIVNNSGYASIPYLPGATPDNGVSANAILFQSGDSATASINLPEDDYTVRSRRTVHSTGNTGYILSIGGTPFAVDSAVGSNDAWEEIAFANPYHSSGGSVTVRVHDGNLWSARVDWIKFIPDNPVPPDPPIEVSVEEGGISFALASNYNYALSSISSNGAKFNSGLSFPTITAYNPSGNHILKPDDSGWQTSAVFDTNSAQVTYSHTGLTVQVDYEITDGMILVTVTPISETTLKVISVSDLGKITYIHQEDPDADDAFLLVPWAGGEIIRIPPSGQIKEVSKGQSWWYSASFFGIGVDHKQGLLFRCPQYGAKWSYGTGISMGKYGLCGGLTSFLRPSGSSDFSYPLLEPFVNIQIVPVGDKNQDGDVDWVDLGVAYRTRFMRRNQTLDPDMLTSAVGKIDLSAPQCSGIECLDYSQILSQMSEHITVPQIWWLVGAHTLPANEFTDPAYSAFPDPAWRGDYFDFKTNAAALGAKIGIHEIFADMSVDNEEWGQVPLRKNSSGQNVNTWGGAGFAIYAKSISDASFIPTLNQHLQNWGVGSGDTWHWDVFTAREAMENYDPANLATIGTDYRKRIEIMQHIESLGISFTSEGLQEGVHEFCDVTWWEPLKMSDWWVYENTFDASEYIPLLPVLFQGLTYYMNGWPNATNILYGARTASEVISLAANKDQINGQLAQVSQWAKVADKTVLDMDQDPSNPQIWTVRYTEGGRLIANLATNSYTIDYCGNSSTIYLPQDLNQDCYVNLADLAQFFADWLHCTDPANPICNL